MKAYGKVGERFFESSFFLPNKFYVRAERSCMHERTPTISKDTFFSPFHSQITKYCEYFIEIIDGNFTFQMR